MWTTRRTDPILAIATVVALVALVACGDPYLHTNPYDAAHVVQITIAGPDTLFSSGAVGQYTVQTIPPWPDTGVVWAIDTFTNFPPEGCGPPGPPRDTILRYSGGGTYQAFSPPLEPYKFTIPIEAWLGSIDSTVSEGTCGGGVRTFDILYPRHVAYKTVVVMQRVTHIQLRCPTTHACAPLAVGDSEFVWVDGFDALGKPITALQDPAANPASGNPPVPYVTRDTAILRVQTGNDPVVTYVSRDATIARTTAIGIRVARVTPVQPGSTWVVATRGALSDSLQIVVH